MRLRRGTNMKNQENYIQLKIGDVKEGDKEMSTNALKTIERDWLKGYIMHDQVTPINPRTDPKNIGRLVTFTRDYASWEVDRKGTMERAEHPNGCCLLAGFCSQLKRRYDVVLHSVLRNASDYTGVAIVANRSDLRAVYAVTRLTKVVVVDAIKELQKELDDYICYADGETYTIEVTDLYGNIVDTAHSIYGIKNAEELLLKTMNYYLRTYSAHETKKYLPQSIRGTK